MNGVVIRRPVELGEAITGAGSFNAGTVIVTVADLSKMILKAGVVEVDIGKVVMGSPVEVTLDAYPRVKFTGKVSKICLSQSCFFGERGVDGQDLPPPEGLLRALQAVGIPAPLYTSQR